VDRVDAIVLAAGQGSRLRPYTESTAKALLEIAPGVTIMDFILSQLRSVEVDDIIIATRPELAEKFKESLGDGVKIVTVDGDGLGNLHTLRAAVGEVDGDKFLVCMSDHIFERSLLRKLLEADSDGVITLCLDRDPPWEKAEEGLKVVLSGGRVKRVGKKLPPISGIDTGLFLFSRKALSMIDEVIRDKGAESSIADLVNYAAKAGKVAYVDTTGKLWMDIDTPEDLVKARKLYWRIVRRDMVKPTDGPVSKYLNRPISTRISLFLYRRLDWLTANHVSVLSFLTALLSAFLFLIASLPLAGVFAQVASILDGVDGELARLRREESAWGGFLDTVLDRFADIALITAIGLSTIKLSVMPVDVALMLTALAAFGIVLVSYITKLSATRLDVHRLRSGFPWATRDVRLFLIMLGGLLNALWLPLIFCAVAPVLFAFKALTLYEKDFHRSMRRIEARPPYPQIKRLKKFMEAKHPLKRKVKASLTELLSNGIKLAIALALIRFVAYALGEAEVSFFGVFSASVSQVLSLLNLLAIIYFGYGMLQSLKTLLELASNRFVVMLGITGTAYRKAAMDIVYLLGILMIWSAVSPLISYTPEELSILRTLVGVVFLVAFALIFYDVAKIFRRNLKGLWDRMIDQISEAITKRLQ